MCVSSKNHLSLRCYLLYYLDDKEYPCGDLSSDFNFALCDVVPGGVEDSN